MIEAIHDSHDLFYRSPFGAVECESNIAIKIKINKKTTPKAVLLNFITDRGKNTEIVLGLDGDDGNFNIFSTRLKIPKQTGLYWYNFTIELEDKTIYYGNNSNMMGGEGEIYESSSPSFQITVYEKGSRTVDWIKDGIIYQIFPDRFRNGNKDGKVNKPIRDMILRSDWMETPKYLKNKAGRVDYFDYFGGNLEGIIEKLDYLVELGITIIYLNPIFEASSNHKYDTADYKKIDAMFGNQASFVRLCEQAKEKGIRIILDGVFSHTGSDSIYFNRYDKYSSKGAYQSVDSPYYSWYKFKNHPDEYESWWGVDALPNVEELDSGYLDYIINDDDSVVNKWSKLGIAGWRLDVADELPDEFIAQFKTALKAADPESVLIGEVWEDASNKTAYGVRRNYLLGKELDSTMNYPFRDTFVDFILEKIDSKQAKKEMMKIYENYPLDHFYSLMNLVGTHDSIRILTVLGEAADENDLSQDEKEDFKLDDEKLSLAIKRLKLLSTVQMTFPGTPSIYYGDEVGVEGYSDPINRRTYPWGHENEELLDWHKLVTSIRKKYDVLRTGSFEILELDKDIFAYIRQTQNSKDVFGRDCDENIAIVLINRSNRQINLEVDLNLNNIKADKFYNAINDEFTTSNGNMLSLEMSRFQAMVLVKNK